MLASLSARVAGLALIVLVALASLAGLLLDASRQTAASFGWVTHSARVIDTTEAAMNALREAESGQRGFVITHDPAYARSVEQRLADSTANMARVVALTRDNVRQNARAGEMAELMRQRAAILRYPLALGRRGDFEQATALIMSGRGRDIMDAVTVRVQVFLDEERVLQATRTQATEHRLAQGRRLALVGAGLVAILIVVGCALLVRSIRRPLDAILQAMTDLGRGGRSRIDARMGSTEFARLARGYNAMADRLGRALDEQAQSERQLQAANAEMQRKGEALRERGDVIALLGGMAHRMQAARTDEELASVIRVFAPRVLPRQPGVLYAHNHSRNLLMPVAAWGGMEQPTEGFPPDQCWALRRGQGHSVAAAGSDIVCAHTDPAEPYHCEPLLAGGEVIGVLHVHGEIGAESRFRLTVLAENIASALVNHRLQRSLREQTIRDPLTGLFNRRYMEEALRLEIARASRKGDPLSVVMCDVDHFKRFNDEFGHDAGDAVLQAVSAEMRSRFRDGDVLCRFGGEEFTVIAPGTTAEALMNRVDLVRRAIADLTIKSGGRTLGATSMSFGIATWTRGMDVDGAELVKAADAALYQAKRAGRNRVLLSQLAA